MYGRIFALESTHAFHDLVFLLDAAFLCKTLGNPLQSFLEKRTEEFIHGASFFLAMLSTLR
jgi:hypothetical protein